MNSIKPIWIRYSAGLPGWAQGSGRVLNQSKVALNQAGGAESPYPLHCNHSLNTVYRWFDGHCRFFRCYPPFASIAKGEVFVLLYVFTRHSLV